jgi:hypothetical protein
MYVIALASYVGSVIFTSATTVASGAPEPKQNIGTFGPDPIGFFQIWLITSITEDKQKFKFSDFHELYFSSYSTLKMAKIVIFRFICSHKKNYYYRYNYTRRMG